MKVELNEIIKELRETCFCPDCGAVMDCYSHYCNSCKEHVVQAIDGGNFALYIAKKYKLGVK